MRRFASSDLFKDDPSVTVGGGEIAGAQVGEQVEKDLARAELFAFPLLFALSFFIFRGLVAALLPLLVRDHLDRRARSSSCASATS